jgi:U4/U6 small nuclear ribonucleoprotein PRP3
VIETRGGGKAGGGGAGGGAKAAAPPPFATSAANRRAREEAERAAQAKREQAEQAERQRQESERQRQEDDARARELAFVDPRLQGRGLGRRPPPSGGRGGRGGRGGLALGLGGGAAAGRGLGAAAAGRNRALEFIEPGSLTRVADEMRVRQQLAAGAGLLGRRGGAGGARGAAGGPGAGPGAAAGTYDAAAAAARAAALREAERRSGVVPEERDAPPLLAEWWDRPLLPKAAAASAGGGDGKNYSAPAGGYDAEVPRWRPDGGAAGGADDHSDLMVPVAVVAAAAPEAAAAANGDDPPAAAAAAAKPPAPPTRPPAANEPFQLVQVAPPQTLAHLREARITAYVEHPVPEPPPAQAPPPPPPPLRLTLKERRKLRTLRRQAREEERRALIRQGLLEPPKPKVRIANLMRVLGAESAADPTAIEREVRRQVAERRAAHDDRNAARMLTPAERRAKRVAKLFDDVQAAGIGGGGGGGGGGEEGDEAAEDGAAAAAAVGAAGAGSGAAPLTTVSVYRVEDLSHGQHRFKVDVNARENRMSGIALVLPPAHRAPLFLATGGAAGADHRFFSLVVVEGCPKSTKRYAKLMLRRIDWNDRPPPVNGSGLGGQEEEEEEEDPPENSCHLVWQGQVASPAFADFARREVPDPASARRLLEAAGVAHYWDAAAGFDVNSAAAAAAAAPPV